MGAGQGLVEHQRQRVDVGGRAHRPPLGLLRRHVGQRPHHVARPCQRLVAHQQRHAEVGELGHPGRALGPRGDHHVERLDVAVHDPAAVGVLQRGRQGHADAHDVAIRQRGGRHQVRERRPLHELGDQVVAVLVAAGLVQRHDPRVVEPGGGQRLALGTPVGARHRLDRHRAVQALVAGQPHGAEAAGPQPVRQAVAAQHQRARGRLGGGLRRLGDRGDQGPGGVHRIRDFHAGCRLPALDGEGVWPPSGLCAGHT